MSFKQPWGWKATSTALAIAAISCGGDPPEQPDRVLRADAQFDPVMSADVHRPISETSRSVAQTFTVERDGQLSQFWLALADGESTDDGTIRILIQPIQDGTIINQVPSASPLWPRLILVDTSTLPAAGTEEFTMFDVSDRSELGVSAGQDFALVVDFVSRETHDDPGKPIARVLGQVGNPYSGGSGAIGMIGGASVGGGFDLVAEDYFFRTFVLTQDLDR